MQNGTVTLELSLAVSYKVKYTLTIWLLLLLNPTQDIYPSKLKIYFHIKDLHKNIYISSIHKCPILETILLPLNRWMIKLWYILKTEYYSAIKRKKLLIKNYFKGSQKHYAEWKKPVSHGYYLSPSLRHSWNDKTIVTENISVTGSIITEKRSLGEVTELLYILTVGAILKKPIHVLKFSELFIKKKKVNLPYTNFKSKIFKK